MRRSPRGAADEKKECRSSSHSNPQGLGESCLPIRPVHDYLATVDGLHKVESLSGRPAQDRFVGKSSLNLREGVRCHRCDIG